MTMEQKFKLKQIELALREAQKEDIITVFLALQHQTFVLSNNVTNLLKKWPPPTIKDPATTDEGPFKSGISFGIKD